MSKGCKIVKSKSGKITAVNNQQGEKSTLFQQILNVPSIALNEAIEMYKGIYSDKLKGKVQFQQTFSPQKGEITQEIIDKLKQNGLSEDVFLMSTQEIDAKLKELGVSDDVRKQVIAYHGSPYSFDRFTTNKMGTGEGAQAFGWGLYFTDLKGVAKNYAERLATTPLKVNKKNIDDYLYSEDVNADNIDYTIIYDAKTKEEALDTIDKEIKTKESLIEEIVEFINDDDNNRTSIANAISRRLDVEKRVQDLYDFYNAIFRAKEYVLNEANRNLYKVSLHKGKTPSEYTWLEWDKKIPDSIYNSVGRKLQSNGKFLNELFQDSMEFEKTDGTKVKGNKPDGLLFYKRISQILGSDKDASLWLLSQGIDGIKYPSESISRGATSDTARGFNYVVFDENAITIEEQIQFQKALNNVGINLITNGFTYKDKTGKDIVVLNKDTATDETLVHEFSHIFSKWQKEARPELWKAGQNLAKNAIESGEIKEIENYVKQTQPNLKEGSEAFLDEVLQEYIGRTSKEMMDEQKQKSPLMQWLSDFWDEIRKMLSLTSMTPEQVANLNLRDFVRASVVDLLKGEVIKGQEAQEYFVRNADRLPLTLSVFSRPEFKDLQGRMVNPQTVTNYLNQSGIKQIEKDLIKQVIQDNFQGQKKISYDELEAVVRANIMPLEKIETDLDSKTRMENLGNYGEAVTLSFFSPLKHGVYPKHGITNKEGSFGHIRKWIKGEIYHLIEVQSDVFQKSNVRDDIDRVISEEYLKEKRKQDNIPFSIKVLQQDVESLENMLNIGIFKNSYDKIKDDIKLKNKELAELNKSKSVLSKISKRDLTNYEKQFIAYQKEFSKRLLRESIKDAVLTGKGVLRFPTVKTAQTIQGYLVTSVRNRYEEIAQILKTERGDNFGTVTDENGFDWYETKIEVSEINNPVIAFQKVIEPQPNFNGYSTYKEAVNNTPLNEDIEIRIDDVVLGSINANNDINNLIRQNILEDKRELQPDGNIVYTTVGSNLMSKLISAEIAKDVLQGKINKEGNVRVEQKLPKPEISSDMETNIEEYGEPSAMAILASEIAYENTPSFGNTKLITEEVDIPTENALMAKLKNLLNQLGIKSMNLDEWEKRMGQKANSNALADIANRIIAFAEGKVNQDTLSEETMHFVVEALDQEKIKPLLEMIHKTDEWAEHSQNYMKKYNGNEALVRKEVFGKVLKNILQENARQQETLQGQSVVRRILNIFKDFIESIKNNLTPAYKKQLKQFADEVYNKLMSEELFDELNLEQFEGNHSVMYQAQSNDVLHNRIMKLFDEAVKVDKQIGNTHSEDLAKVSTNIDELSKLEAITGIASVIKKQVNYLMSSGKSRGLLSIEERLVLNTTIEMGSVLSDIQPQLNVIKGYKTEVEKAKISVTDAQQNLSELNSKLNKEKSDRFDDLVEDIATSRNLTEVQKDIIRRELDSQDRDTNQVYAAFGGLIHSSKAALNMLGKVIREMHTTKEAIFSKEVSTFFNKLNKHGYSDESVASVLKSFVDGDFILSAYNHEEFIKAQAEIKLNVYNDLAKNYKDFALPTLEDIINEEYQWKSKLQVDDIPSYEHQTKKKIREAKLTVDSLVDTERKKINEITDNMSETSQRILQRFKSNRSRIILKAEKNGGFSSEDNQQLQELSSKFDFQSSAYELDGGLRKGLLVDEDNNVYTKDKTKLDSDSLVALELSEYRRAMRDLFGKDTTSLHRGFYNNLDGKVTELKDYFTRNNIRIFYSDKFWSSFNREDGLVSKLRKLEDNSDALLLADNIEKANKRLKNILKRNQKYNNPSEISYETLTMVEEKEVKDITSQLEVLFNNASKYVKSEKKDNNTVSVASADFYNELNNRGIKGDFEATIDFIKNHVTQKNQLSILKAQHELKQGNINKNLLPYLSEGLNEEEALMKFAESKLLPYFKTMKLDTNVGGEEIIQQISGAKSLEEYMKVIEDNPMFNITPSFIFDDVDNSERMNKEYIKRIKNNEPIINLTNEKFVNKKFFERFGIPMPDKDGSFELIPTKNEQEFEAWKEYIAFKEKAMQYAKMEGKENKYLLPQYRRGMFSRIAQVASDMNMESVKQTVKDIFTYREDQPDNGQDFEGNVQQTFNKNTLTIPKTGWRKIKDKGEVTDELLYSSMLLMKEAITYETRSNAWADVESVLYHIKTKGYNGKEKESTETYKQASNFIRSNIYGQSETLEAQTDLFGLLSRKVSIAPAVNVSQKFVRHNNLMFGILTPMTSFLQGSVNFLTERIVGDRINKDASNMAFAEASKLIPRAVSEQFNVREKSKLNKIYQFMGVSNVSKNFENSDYGRGLRNTLDLSKSGYVTHFMADAPIQAQTMLSVLHDYRIVNGEFMDWNRFRRMNRTLTNSQANAEWKNYRDLTLYKFMDETSETIELDDAEIKKAGVYEWNEKIKKNLIESVRNKYALTKQDIDYQLTEGDKGIIQRNALLSWTTLHKGWLATAFIKRYKSYHVNMMTDLMEEGSHYGAMRFIADMAKNLKRKGVKEAFKDYYREYNGGYTFKNNVVLDEHGKPFKTIENFNDLRIDDNGDVVSRETYKGKGWNSLDKVYVDNNYNVFYDNAYNIPVNARNIKENVDSIMSEYYNDLVFQFSQMRQTSVKRASVDLIVSSMLAVLAISLSNLADDDDDDYAKEFLAYSTYRLASEVSSQSVALPAQIYAFLESPTVGMSQLQNALDFFDVFDTEEINRGTFKDYTKSQAWFLKMLPGLKEYSKIRHIDRTRNSFEFFNRKNLKFTLAAGMLE